VTWQQQALIVALVLCVIAPPALLGVYVVRVLLRMFALRTAVRFLAIDGAQGAPRWHAAIMYSYIVRGKVK
jgi:hypothetical protein